MATATSRLLCECVRTPPHLLSLSPHSPNNNKATQSVYHQDTGKVEQILQLPAMDAKKAFDREMWYFSTYFDFLFFSSQNVNLKSNTESECLTESKHFLSHHVSHICRFMLKKRKTVCANPSQKWVQNLMTVVDKQQSNQVQLSLLTNPFRNASVFDKFTVSNYGLFVSIAS